MGKNSSDYSEAFVSIFFLLGLVVIAIGIYLIATDNTAIGISTGGRGLPRAGTVTKIRGEFILVGGIIFTAFPAFAIFKRIFRKLSNKHS